MENQFRTVRDFSTLLISVRSGSAEACDGWALFINQLAWGFIKYRLRPNIARGARLQQCNSAIDRKRLCTDIMQVFVGLTDRACCQTPQQNPMPFLIRLGIDSVSTNFNSTLANHVIAPVPGFLDFLIG